MIQQIQRMRPDFRLNDLRLGGETGELSYIPDEFAPHTVTATLTAPKVCELLFEYSFDEDPRPESSAGPGIRLTVGKYTGKVLKIWIRFASVDDLIEQVVRVGQLLKSKEYLLPKDSYRKNMQLARRILDDFVEFLSHDPKTREAVSKSW